MFNLVKIISNLKKIFKLSESKVKFDKNKMHKGSGGYDYLVKLLIVGDSAVGKTCILL